MNKMNFTNRIREYTDRLKMGIDCLIWQKEADKKITQPDQGFLSQMNYPNPELNPRCFQMYVLLCQTVI